MLFQTDDRKILGYSSMKMVDVLLVGSGTSTGSLLWIRSLILMTYCVRKNGVQTTKLLDNSLSTGAPNAGEAGADKRILSCRPRCGGQNTNGDYRCSLSSSPSPERIDESVLG
jgi:hypothetical protein